MPARRRRWIVRNGSALADVGLYIGGLYEIRSIRGICRSAARAIRSSDGRQECALHRTIGQF